MKTRMSDNAKLRKLNKNFDNAIFVYEIGMDFKSTIILDFSSARKGFTKTLKFTKNGTINKIEVLELAPPSYSITPAYTMATKKPKSRFLFVET
jgi:hypothetical protein